MLPFDAGHLGLNSFIALITGFWKNTDHDFLVTACFCLLAVAAASSGGDFMSDLFNKLAMRRKGEASFCFRDTDAGVSRQLTCHVHTAGISGKGPAGGEAGDAPSGTGGAFARMSDVIPPLPVLHSNTDDDDWDA